jgi:hypothetical protein
MKTTFYDRHEKRDYYKVIEVMRQLEADPSWLMQRDSSSSNIWRMIRIRLSMQ